jgi:tetratricopeptide (TPR) repeat protein
VRPQFLLLDDLHWGDESTLLLVEHLAATLPEIPSLVIGTYRDTELDPARPLARIMTSLHRRHLVHRVSLRRLPESDVALMLRALSGGQEPPPAVAAEIYAETEGNAFFVEEVFRHLVEQGLLLDDAGQFRTDMEVSELDVPEGIRLVIGHRLERLSKTTRTVLTTAAVSGRDVSYGLLQAMEEAGAGDLLDAVDEAEQANLIVSGSVDHEVRYRFAHELIRQTLLAGLSLPRRQQTHLRVAQALEQVYGVDRDLHAAEIANHLFQAGEAADRAQTSRYLGVAGQRALDAAAFGEALRSFDAALDLHPADDRRGRVDLLIGRGRAWQGLGNWQETMSTWGDALDALESMDEPEAVGALSLDLSSQLSWAYRFREAFAVAQRGLAALGDRPTLDRARLLSRSGLILSLGGFFEPAEAGMAEARRLTAGGNRAAEAELFYSETVAHFVSGRPRKSVESGQRADQIFRDLGNLWFDASVQPFIAQGLHCTGRHHDVEEMAPAGLDLAERVGHRGAYLFMNRVRAGSGQALRPDPRRRVEEAKEDLELATVLGPTYMADSWVWMGSGQFVLGDWDAARASFERAIAMVEPEAVWQGSYQGHLIWLLACMGERDASSELLEECRPLLPVPGQLNRVGQWDLVALAAQAMAVLEDSEKASWLLPLVEAAIQNGCVYRGYENGLFSTSAGMAASACSRWSDSERYFEKALGDCEAFENRDEQPVVQHAFGTMLSRRNRAGDKDRARELLSTAATGFRDMSAPRHEALAHDALTALG